MKERDSLHIKLARQVGGAIACLLALALLLGLTACGSGQAQQLQAEPPVAAAEPPEPEEPEPETEPDPVPDQPVPADPEEPEDDDDHDGFPETEDGEEHPTGLPFTQEEFDQLVADTLAPLVNDDMTVMEQARAVFDYVHANIRYTGISDKSDWMTGAYDGMTTGRGDCFTYYAVSRALLTALGIDNLEVRRIEGTSSKHYWNLVNCGDGWYHFDACPRSLKMPSFLSFMVTDQQVADFTAMAGRHYYDFDDSLLPERATEIITKTRPVRRPVETEVEEEQEGGDGEEANTEGANTGEANAENPEAAVSDEPVLPPDDLTSEGGSTTEPSADWTEPGLDSDASDPSAAPDDSSPTDVWTEPAAEDWSEPTLDDGGETEAG